jgi:hypothetical protein
MLGVNLKKKSIRSVITNFRLVTVLSSSLPPTERRRRCHNLHNNNNNNNNNNINNNNNNNNKYHHLPPPFNSRVQIISQTVFTWKNIGEALVPPCHPQSYANKLTHRLEDNIKMNHSELGG